MIWPVIQLAFEESKNSAKLAISSVVPIRFIGCRCAFASLFCSVLSKEEANGESVSEGAMPFTLIFGAYSAANALTKPSIAPFDAET